MASKALLLVLACFLLINTKVSSHEEERILTEASSSYKKPIAIAPAPAPLSPASPPIAKAAPPTPPPAVKVSPPPPAKASPPPPPPPPPRNTAECSPLCVERCKNHSRKNRCMRACVTCCLRCKCVPPGQYGNKHLCGNGKCYSDMTTRGGLPKCP